MDIHFSCTICGRCCRNLKLPLTIAESIRWLNDGNDVQVICEAVPWREDPPPEDLQAAHKRRRSFAAISGTLPTRVIVILAAGFAGACPYLQADMRCGTYPDRPLVCRIYPAEINPFIPLDPARKACPPEAWTTDRPLLQRRGQLMDDATLECIKRSRQADEQDVEAKRRLCEALNLTSAALANEGFVVYSPDRTALLAELERPVDRLAPPPPPPAWRFMTNQRATVDSLRSAGALLAERGAAAAHGAHFEYLGFKPPSD